MLSAVLAVAVAQFASFSPGLRIFEETAAPELLWVRALGKTRTELYELHRKGELLCLDMKGESVLYDPYSIEYTIAKYSDDGPFLQRATCVATFDNSTTTAGSKVVSVKINLGGDRAVLNGKLSPRATMRDLHISGPLLGIRPTSEAFASSANLWTSIPDGKSSKVAPFEWRIQAQFGQGALVEVGLTALGPWDFQRIYDPERRTSTLTVAKVTDKQYLQSFIRYIEVLPVRHFSNRIKLDLNQETWMEEYRAYINSQPRSETIQFSQEFLTGWKQALLAHRVPSSTSAKPSTGIKVTGAAAERAPVTAKPWLVILASEPSEKAAKAFQAKADKKLGGVSVSRSKDFRLLKPGLWIAYLGPYATKKEADFQCSRASRLGFSGYVKQGR